MREIKFRMWNRSEKRMMKGPWFNTYDSVWINEFADSISSEGFDVMQYTGLNDKNGKEIYEGHIIKAIRKDEIFENQSFFNPIRRYKYTEAFRDEVKYDGPLLKPFSDFYSSLGKYWNLLEWEVIGNIYENPELLKEKQIESSTETICNV